MKITRFSTSSKIISLLQQKLKYLQMIKHERVVLLIVQKKRPLIQYSAAKNGFCIVVEKKICTCKICDKETKKEPNPFFFVLMLSFPVHHIFFITNVTIQSEVKVNLKTYDSILSFFWQCNKDRTWILLVFFLRPLSTGS